MSEEEVLDREDGDVNGECSVCGKYKARIDKGRLSPCFLWKRIKDKDEEEQDGDTK
jgi:hypothetical protein